ncbi:MAG: hypothetical protein JXA49_06075 [Actinobacteria bacterium]|nr:hypothetical protein [Actinomycetota bacterium]
MLQKALELIQSIREWKIAPGAFSYQVSGVDTGAGGETTEGINRRADRCDRRSIWFIVHGNRTPMSLTTRVILRAELLEDTIYRGRKAGFGVFVFASPALL